MSPQKVVFGFEVPNISQRIESNKFSTSTCIWDVVWTIRVWKVVTDSSESLGVQLLCLNESNENWSYAATVKFRLCSFDDDVRPIETKIHPKVINKIDNSISPQAFIQWGDLIDTEKFYVENDTIKTEFVIEVANLNLPDKSVLQFEPIPLNFCRKFDLSIENTKKLLAIQSPEFDVLSEKYSLVIYKYEEHLDVELCQRKDVEASRRPMMLVKLISDKGEDKCVVQHSQFRTEKLISWKELRRPENGFNYDNRIKFEVQIIPDCVYQETKEIFRTILSARNVASTSTSTFSFGNSPDTITSMAASSTLNKEMPSLPVNVPASPMSSMKSQSQQIVSTNGTKIAKFQALAGADIGKHLEDHSANRNRSELGSAQPGLFESTPQDKSMFGASATPKFGESTTSLFGACATPKFGESTTSLFGASATPKFGESTTSLFGASAAPRFGGSTTGLFGATLKSPFGAQSTNTLDFFGASSIPVNDGDLFSRLPLFSQSQQILSANGTKNVKFQPPAGVDTLMNNGKTSSVQTQLHCITAMKEYEGKCLEELRSEDYSANRKGSELGRALSALFESTPQNKSIFGAQSTTNQLNGFGAPTIRTSGGVARVSAATSSAPVPTFSLNTTEKPNELVTSNGPSIATSTATQKITSSTNQLSAERWNSAVDSKLIFKNLAKHRRSEKFLLSIKDVNNLTVDKSPKFLIDGREYEFVAQRRQNHLQIALKALCCNLRTQPIMLVTLLSSKGTDKSVMQYTRFRTEGLTSWDELRNPENGVNDDDLINIEVTIATRSIDFVKTEEILQLDLSSLTNLSVRRFCIEVSEVSKLNSYFTSIFMIRGILWHVKVCKKTFNAKQYLAVYLRLLEQSRANGSDTMSYKVKLISFSDNVRAFENHSEPYVFSSGNFEHGGHIIDWNDLFDATKYYVKNDKIILDIKLNFYDPKTTSKAATIVDASEIDRNKFKLTMENVDSLVAVEWTHPNFPLFDFQLYRNQDQLGVVLFHFDERPLTMVVELLSSKGEDKSVIKVENGHGGIGNIRTMVTTWSELFNPDNGFVNNNSITLECTISYDSEDLSDVSELASAETLNEIETDCSICLDDMKKRDASEIPCGHVFCTQCITNVLQNTCPLCRKPFTSTDIRPVILP